MRHRLPTLTPTCGLQLTACAEGLIFERSAGCCDMLYRKRVRGLGGVLHAVLTFPPASPTHAPPPVARAKDAPFRAEIPSCRGLAGGPIAHGMDQLNCEA